MATAVEAPSPTIPATTFRSLRHARGLGIPIAASLGVIALAIWNSVHKSLWTDEAYSLLTASHSIAGTWHQALHFELQPPLYFLLLNIWLRLGVPTAEWARSFSTLCVLGCVVVLWLAIRSEWTGRGVPAPLTAVLTATVAWAAAETRDYALTLLLSALSYWLFLRLVTDRTSHRRIDAICYAVVAYLSLLTMYYSGFILLGQWVAAMVVRRGRWLLTFALAAVGVAMLPWVSVILGQMSTHVNLNLPFSVEVAQAHLPGGAVALLLRNLLGAVFAAAPILDRPYVALVLAALLAVVPVIRLLGLGRAGSRTTPLSGSQWSVTEMALTVAFGVSVVALVALRVSNLALVWPRHMTALAPGFVLLWSVWSSRAPSIRRAGLAGALILGVAAFTLVSYERNVDVADSRGVAAYVAAHAPADPVLIVGPEAVFAFRYYYKGYDHGAGPVLGVPADASLQTYDPDRVRLTDTAQIDARVAESGARHSYWLVVSKELVWHSTEAAAVVDQFLHSRVPVRDSVDFKNIYVVHASVTSSPE